MQVVVMTEVYLYDLHVFLRKAMDAAGFFSLVVSLFSLLHVTDVFHDVIGGPMI